jgi:putative ABC transport system permease protein
MAVRAALGGSPMRLLRQLVTESILLSLAGGVAGAALAGMGVNLMLRLSPAQLPRAAEVQVNPAVLAVALALSVLCGIVFGSIPALHVLGLDLDTGLRSDSRGASGGPRHGRLRRALVVAQVALSFVLLAGAGLLIRSFLVLDGVDPGFRGARVLTARLSLPSNRYSARRELLTFHDRLLARLSALPGVELAGATNILPLSGLLTTADFTIQGVATPPGKAGPTGDYRVVDAGYFGTMGIPILAGRGIRASDTDRTMSVAVASQSLARRYWPNAAAVGSHILLDDDSFAPPRVVEIVGVASDVRWQSLEEAPMECLYVPLAQIPEDVVSFLANNFFWVARTSQSPAALRNPVRREIHAVDGDVAAAAIQPMTQYLDQSFAARRFALEIFGAFAAAALLLAAAGLYALVSYSVAQRTREIGVRMALGATQRSVLLLVVREGLELAAVGIVAGVAGAIALTRTMSALLFGVSALDPATLVSVGVLLLGVAGAACCFPARRAARVNPAVAWRSE